DGATPPVNATAAYGDTFIDSLLGNISSLIPTITGDGPSHTVGDQIYSGLVTFDKDLNPVGELAQSWEFSRDCRDLTFRLRPGVKWHDGRPFTADDVVFTWQTIVDPKTPSPYKSEYALVESVRAEGADVVRVHYSQPFAKALTNWGTWMLPRHLLETYVREGDRKSTRLNSSHGSISYAVFCLKKKMNAPNVLLDLVVPVVDRLLDRGRPGSSASR